MISLFDYDDEEMRPGKNGDFERENSQRWNANNSAVWPAGGLTQLEFARQFLEMVESGRGEPGIFNREAALAMQPDRRAGCRLRHQPLRRDRSATLAVLQPLHRRGAPATTRSRRCARRSKSPAIIGTIQSLATQLPRPAADVEAELRGGAAARRRHHRPDGQPDRPGCRPSRSSCARSPSRQPPDRRSSWESISRPRSPASSRAATPPSCSIAPPACTRAGRPTTSATSASRPTRRCSRCCGTPACRWTPRMARRPRTPTPGSSTSRSSRPMARSPATTARRSQQCEYWLQNKVHWTEHNPSVTITYRPDEVLDLMRWVWEHRDISAAWPSCPPLTPSTPSFRTWRSPKRNTSGWRADFPDIDFSKIYRYEQDDLTNAAQELACSAASVISSRD